MRTANHVILLVIDDLRANQFQELLNEGQLPNIQKLTGIYSNSTACYPAITYPAQSTILTGCYPDTYGFPGGHWVNRNEKTIRNYNSFKELDTVNDELGNTKTIFELVEGTTACLSIGLTRGSNHYYPTKRQIIALYLWHWIIWHRDMQILNKLVMNKLMDYFNRPRKYFGQDPPRLVVT
ncbi:MAG: alkaline phosphatase family protein, partial [Candidatus Helarchaeota archaeon]